MKARPKPKKISFIKLTSNNQIKNYIKSYNTTTNKPSKTNKVLNNNILIINSTKNNCMSSINKYNEKLLNKIKEYSAERQIMNYIISKSPKNIDKKNKIKYSKEINKENELKFNFLENSIKNNTNMKKIKNRNNNNFNTDRQVNPFSHNIMVNITESNQNDINKNRRNNNINIKYISKKKRKEIFCTYLKLSKKNNVKRNECSNKRMFIHKKYFKKEESNDEFNINNSEENDHFDIHTSYNLTKKNLFNLYNSDARFFSAKNMLEKALKKKKINYVIKEENEPNSAQKQNRKINKLKFDFKKCQTYINNKDNNLKISYENQKDIKSENINGKKFNENIKKITRKENDLSALQKNKLIISDINKEAEIKELCSPEAYSFENRRNNEDKSKDKKTYFILNKKKNFTNKRFSLLNHLDKENNKLMENKKNLKINKNYQNSESFFTRRRIYNENKKKSKSINKINKFFYKSQKSTFINSPNIQSSFISKKKDENSLDNIIKRGNKFKFNKLSKNNSKSKSHSKPKSKSSSKSQINKVNVPSAHINKLNKIIFSIKTNWGNDLKLGINNIKLLDKNNKNIPIINSNFDITKPLLMKYIKGDIKKLTIEYDANHILKNIVILNGFNDMGIKYLLIENNQGKLLWKGVIPQVNMIDIKSFYISIENHYLNKNTALLYKTVHLNKVENIIKHVSNNNTIKNSRMNDSSENIKNYVICDRIKIKLINNYGNKDYIGLSGIQFYDNNNKLINIIQNKKDIKINEEIMNLKEKKILYNLFNNKNDTINPKDMFLTTNLNAFINIEFKQNLKISKIIFYNYNNNEYKDCATKGISLDFYINNKRQNIIDKLIYLYKPPGEKKIDYGQTLTYPFDENIYFINKIQENLAQLESLGNNNNKIIYNEEFQYYCPSFPFGHILKFELYSNYGNKNYIGIENIQIFNEENKELLLFPSLNKNKTKDNNNMNDIYPKIYILPEETQLKQKSKPLILSKLYNFNDVENDLGENRIYFIFNHCIGISKICIYNYEKYFDIAAKHIQIFCDDNIIFEGDLKNIGINDIYFCNKKCFNNIIEKKKILSKNINKSTESEIKFNGCKKDLKNKINLDRYIEYEGKSGAKILKLSE